MYVHHLVKRMINVQNDKKTVTKGSQNNVKMDA